MLKDEKKRNHVSIAVTSSEPTVSQNTTSYVTSTPACKPKTIDATISFRRNLLGGLPNVTTEPTTTTFNLNETQVLSSSAGTTANLGNAPSYTHYENHLEDPNRPVHMCCRRLRKPTFNIKPFDGNPKNYSWFRTSFMALYHNEFEGDAAKLCVLRELLEEKVRNEVNE